MCLGIAATIPLSYFMMRRWCGCGRVSPWRLWLLWAAALSWASVWPSVRASASASEGSPPGPASASPPIPLPFPSREWRCPPASRPPAVTCACDLPHTLRCSGGGKAALRALGTSLRKLSPSPALASSVSLLDLTVQGVRALGDDGPLLAGVALHGLVVSSGELKRVGAAAFSAFAAPLQALGLPNNLLDAVPSAALAPVARALDRLDLSRNRLRALDGASLKGLSNLTFLELSENRLSELSADAFSPVPALQTLRLRGNRLGEGALAALAGLDALRDLDLSDNQLAGPLGASTLPPLPSVRALQLAHNRLSSVKRGALRGLRALGALALHHNQIDVLEDHAFRHLGALVSLDLAHNRIVAVSGSSLAHLHRLTQLDLAHNFLRALTADLTVSLASLRELRLDDNDISMVTSDAVAPELQLHRLTLADNPLNCDCSLTQFAAWLVNSSHLPEGDRATAICATPPSLENGLLVQVPPSDLLCGDDSDDAEDVEEEEEAGASEGERRDAEGPLSMRGASPADSKASLHSFRYDGVQIFLSWNVDAGAVPYACNSLIVYEEEEGGREVLVESVPLRCNSSQVPEPTTLSVSLRSVDLQEGRNYRYCVLLLEGSGSGSDDVSMDWGCSGVLPLSRSDAPLTPPPPAAPRISGVVANVTGSRAISVSVSLQGVPSPDCTFALALYSHNAMKAMERVNCSRPRVLFPDAAADQGPFRVCAALEDFPSPGSQALCVPVEGEAGWGALGGLAVASAAVLVTAASILAFHAARKHLFRRPKTVPAHQYFLTAPKSDQQHSRYVKLQATTRL